MVERLSYVEQKPSGDISVVVRVRNERENLGHLLDLLEDQTRKHQLIVVDNASTDGTAELARGRGALVVPIEDAEFSYPKASNLGVEKADGALIVFMSAHSFPRDKLWLDSGATHFTNPIVAGVYHKPIPRKDTTLTDKVAAELAELLFSTHKVRVETRPASGQLGATNVMIRGSLLKERPFNEKYGSGGEDGEWARWAISQGNLIIRDPAFIVYHSHGLGPIGWVKQYNEWLRKMNGRPFDRSAIEYRRGEKG